MLSKSQIKRRIKIFIAHFKRIGLINTDFTIISNNCWGGLVYDEFHLPYLTPTIGCWILSADFIRFISNLELYLKSDLVQISVDDCHAKNLLIKRKSEGKYKFDLKDLIIGRVYDVDIIFLHYHSFSEAKEKWKRRCKRVNWNNIIVKYNDQNGFEEWMLEKFCLMDYKHKLFFTANKMYLEYDWCYLFDSKDQDGNVDDTVVNKQPFRIKYLLNNILKEAKLDE